MQLTSSTVPTIRVRAMNDHGVDPNGAYVLYWMTAHRRCGWNFGLDRAMDWARELGRPLLVFEALRCGYPWASDRLHTYVIQGMADNARRLASSPCGYFPYVEQRHGEGSGLLAELASRAAVVVTDDFPCFFLPRMLHAAAPRLPVSLEAVDSNGLLPMRAADRTFARAVDFRRFLQKSLAPHLADFPSPDPLVDCALPSCPPLPSEITERWPVADLERLTGGPDGLSHLPIDHAVAPIEERGGPEAASELLQRFIDRRLTRYVDGRLDVIDRSTSSLSPALHFGHLSAHEFFAAIVGKEGWSPDRIAGKATGSRAGWWGMSEPAEAFLDQLVTWRELGYNAASQSEAFDRYESLPAWARTTLREHADDPRPYEYDLETFETASTHDELWNAAQRELVRDGRIHNYLRMLWGKKIFEWSPDARTGLAVMVELNNKYAVDGRNPNSYSGILWCLGKYDRAWGPERQIYGKVRYMTSDSTRRKLDAKRYLAEFGDGPAQLRLH